MNNLLINDQPVSESTYWDGEGYRQHVLKGWQEKKVKIQCSCQKYVKKAELHVRKSKKGYYTLANNPGHSDKHTLTCSYYGEVERATVQTVRKPPVEKEGNRLIIHVRLFTDRGEGEETGDWLNPPDSHSPQEHSRTNPNELVQNQQQSHFRFSDFVYQWYLEAVKQLKQGKKKMTHRSVLYIMFQMLIERRLWIGPQDFKKIGVIPNASLKVEWLRGKRVVVGWVRKATRDVNKGTIWEIEGYGEKTLSVYIKDPHIPTYPVEGKLAFLRVDFDQKEPCSISAAKAWTITEGGWWLHNQAEWQLIHLLRERGWEVSRPFQPSDEWLGYQPDFVAKKDNRKVLLDVLEEPVEELIQRAYRKKQEEVYRAASREKVITYIPWRLGDRLDI